MQAQPKSQRRQNLHAWNLKKEKRKIQQTHQKATNPAEGINGGETEMGWQLLVFPQKMERRR